MIEPFLLNAILACICLSFISGPLGSFVLWSRFVYFTDTIAHSFILGGAISVLLNVHYYFIVILMAVIFSFILLYYNNSNYTNIVTAVITSTTVSMGLIIISLNEDYSYSFISNLLSGDILAISNKDVIMLYISTIISLIVILLCWKQFLRSLINQDIAKVIGLNINVIKLKITLLISLFVASAIQITGFLLVSSLLIIPAISARNFSSSPIRMVILSSLFTLLSTLFGLYLSIVFNVSTNALIVMTALLIMMLSGLNSKYFHIRW